jgi:hypothetical protein
MFSTLTAITSWLLGLPPVSGSVALALEVVVGVADGVAIGGGADELAETELAGTGCTSGRFSAAAAPMPPVTTTAAAATAITRARFMN